MQIACHFCMAAHAAIFTKTHVMQIYLPVSVVSLVAVGGRALGPLERQQIAIGHEREAPPLHYVSADGIVGSRVIDSCHILLVEGMHVELVAQLLLTQHSRYEVLSKILQSELTCPDAQFIE